MGIGAISGYAGNLFFNLASKDFSRSQETGKPADPSLLANYGTMMKGQQYAETFKMSADIINIFNNKNESGTLGKQSQALENATKQDIGQNPNTSEDDDEFSLEDLKCETCENRKYVDVSDDSGVSYQVPTNISRGAAAARVISHEHEHVSREQDKARLEDKEVVSQGVKIQTDICPECGAIYVSGGSTTTTTRDKAHSHNEEGIELVKNIDYFEKRSEELRALFMVGTENIDAGSIFDQIA